ncbi:YARHG domain-containing protein [Bosea eneae]|uniref:YARHG domain-containing protein n=1 Tax=Bosea eneae TaxID=151454 RepID=A0ABW0IP37_9HYPH
MSKLLLPALSLTIALPFFVAATPAAAQSCEDLWYQRNEIYKAQGYCFRTQRGISAFGNAGCQYDNVEDVPLSATQRRVIADIQRAERTQRCPR